MLGFDKNASPVNYVKFLDDQTVEYPGPAIDKNGSGVDVIVKCRESITRESGVMTWKLKCEECPFWKPVFGLVSAKETEFTEWDNMWCVNVRGMWGSSTKYPNVDVNKEGSQDKWDFKDGDVFELTFDPYTTLLTMKNERLGKSTTRKLLGDTSNVCPAVKVYHDNNQCGLMRMRLLERRGQSRQEWDEERNAIKSIATVAGTMKKMTEEMSLLRQELVTCRQEIATVKQEVTVLQAEVKALSAKEQSPSPQSQIAPKPIPQLTPQPTPKQILTPTARPIPKSIITPLPQSVVDGIAIMRQDASFAAAMLGFEIRELVKHDIKVVLEDPSASSPDLEDPCDLEVEQTQEKELDGPEAPEEHVKPVTLGDDLGFGFESGSDDESEDEGDNEDEDEGEDEPENGADGGIDSGSDDGTDDGTEVEFEDGDADVLTESTEVEQGAPSSPTSTRGATSETEGDEEFEIIENQM